MFQVKKHHLPLFILNGCAIVIYILVVSNLNSSISDEVLFSTSDAVTYRDVAIWLTGGIDSLSVSTRPFLYPLVLAISTGIAGAIGIWFLQVLFWLMAVNFIFLTIKQLSKSYIFAFLGAAIFLSNISLIALTLHALTEVTSVFLMSMMVYFLSKRVNDFKEVSFFHTCLLFFVLLAVIKPVFSIPLFFFLFIAFPLLYLRKHINQPKHFLKLFLILVPLLLQLTIMKSKFDQITISVIGENTLSRYFVAQGIEKIDSKSRDESVEKALSFSKEERKNYLFDNSSVYMELFETNLKGNITGAPTFLFYPKGTGNEKFAEFMGSYNRATLKVHYIFIPLTFILLLIFLWRKEYPILLFTMFLYLLAGYYIITTGISFWQGDRLTLPAICLWACVYPFVLFSYFKIIKSKLVKKE